MRIDVLSIFPDLVDSFTKESLIGKARKSNLLDLRLHNIRDHATDRHSSVDDAPFGGGAGMVMKPEPIFETFEQGSCSRPLIYLNPAGQRFDQVVARELASLESFSLLCGRYEGVDERVRSHLVDREISIGDYVLSGGEVAALVVIEAVVRLLPNAVGNASSIEEESFSSGLLEHPHYTRPAEYRGWRVPEVLLSGNHPRIERWRLLRSLLRTEQTRPDLLEARGGITESERIEISGLGFPD